MPFSFALGHDRENCTDHTGKSEYGVARLTVKEEDEDDNADSNGPRYHSCILMAFRLLIMSL